MTFEEQRLAALAVLSSDSNLTKKAGSFLGQIAVDACPLTDKQLDWFGTLCERAGVKLPGASE